MQRGIGVVAVPGTAFETRDLDQIVQVVDHPPPPRTLFVPRDTRGRSSAGPSPPIRLGWPPGWHT